MSRKVVLFIAMSLDGYIATEKDSIDWLEAIEGLGDNGYKQFYNTVDTLIMGRRTYDWVMNQGKYPYKGKQSYVLTHRPEMDTSSVKFVSDVEAIIKSLRSQVGKDIWLVGGGDIVRQCLHLGLIDSIILTIAPVVLGSGIRLFGEDQINLKQTKIEVFNQFTQITYRVC